MINVIIFVISFLIATCGENMNDKKLPSGKNKSQKNKFPNLNDIIDIDFEKWMNLNSKSKSPKFNESKKSKHNQNNYKNKKSVFENDNIAHDHIYQNFDKLFNNFFRYINDDFFYNNKDHKNYNYYKYKSSKKKQINAVNKCYKILKIKKDASIPEIKKAYKKLAMKYHPDRNGKNVKQAQANFIKISNAYEKLKKYKNFN